MKGISIGFVILFSLGTLFSVSGCAEEFEPFNSVQKLRILAVQADPPTIIPKESTTLRALVHSPETSEISYQWDWCPVRLGGTGNNECAIDEAQLDEALGQVGTDGSAPIPAFDLGQTEEVSLSYFLDPLVLSLICSDLVSNSIPEFAGLLSCDETFPISVRLTVTSGEETASALKTVHLALDSEGTTNANPSIDGVSAKLQRSENGEYTSLPEQPPSNLGSGEGVDLRADFDETIAETFTPAATADEPNPDPRRERLFLTWFITAGETESGRTGFIDGTSTYDDLRYNTWFTPGNGQSAHLFLVMQDERGGVDFIERSIDIVED